MKLGEMLSKRTATHGDFNEVAHISQAFKNHLREVAPRELPCQHREALDMICHKMSRILAGDFNELDHWADIEGYARLIQLVIMRIPLVPEPTPDGGKNHD